MSRTSEMGQLEVGRAYLLLVRVGDRSDVAWHLAGQIVRTQADVEVAFVASRAASAEILWQACTVSGDGFVAGAPEVSFGVALCSGSIAVVAAGRLGSRALAELSRGVRRADRRVRGLEFVGPRAPRCAWPAA